MELERQTRALRIDPKLTAAGWHIVRLQPDEDWRGKSRCAIEEFETAHGLADYALCDNGSVLGVVEAKKLTLGPEGVLSQAARYSRGLPTTEFDLPDGHKVPFLYSTNGERIMFHDVRNELSRSREVSHFHTIDALREMLGSNLDSEVAHLSAIPMHGWIRPYQVEANEAIEDAIAHRKRKLLVTMATGTGKTLMTVHEVYRLMKSGAARRVLFLVDRKSLAAQAVRAFKCFEAEPGKKFDSLYEVYSQRFQREDFDDDEKFDVTVLPNKYLTQPKPGSSFVRVCTIQRMTINLFGRSAVFTDEEGIEDDAEQLDIPIHAFDLIVIVTEPSEYITERAIRETNAKVFPVGTLIVAMYGEGQTRGRVAELGIAATTNQALAALVFDDQTQRLRSYLKILLLQNCERARQLTFGGVQPNLSLGLIRDMTLPVPPYEEQVEIARRVDQLLERANGIQQRIDAASSRVAHSSQTILSKAFRGELVTEGHDASALDGVGQWT